MPSSSLIPEPLSAGKVRTVREHRRNDAVGGLVGQVLQLKECGERRCKNARVYRAYTGLIPGQAGQHQELERLTGGT
jgi:hypothetical protein